MPTWTLYEGDCLEVMRELPDNSLRCPWRSRVYRARRAIRSQARGPAAPSSSTVGLVVRQRWRDETTRWKWPLRVEVCLIIWLPAQQEGNIRH